MPLPIAPHDFGPPPIYPGPITFPLPPMPGIPMPGVPVIPISFPVYPSQIIEPTYPIFEKKPKPDLDHDH